MYSRQEFNDHLVKSAQNMTADSHLKAAALELLVEADRYDWVHQTTWFGEPILNIPHDMFALQEIIFRTRPEFIIEVGVAWGGSLLFYSTLMEVLGGEKVIGVDIYIPDDLKSRLLSFEKLSSRIHLINGSSIDESTIKQIDEIVKGSRRVMILLDSHHSHQHVLSELKLYEKYVGKGCYLVCGDTIVESIPPQTHRPREWGPGNNPMTALNEFLAGNLRFKNDHELEQKLLLTCNPSGYLRALTD